MSVKGVKGPRLGRREAAQRQKQDDRARPRIRSTIDLPSSESVRWLNGRAALPWEMGQIVLARRQEREREISQLRGLLL